MSDLTTLHPTNMVSVRDVFGIDTELKVPAFEERDEHVPDIDATYRFNPAVTLALLAGFGRDRRVIHKYFPAFVRGRIEIVDQHAAAGLQDSAAWIWWAKTLWS